MRGRRQALLGAIGSLLLVCGPGDGRADDHSSDPRFVCPGGVAVDDSGNVYVCGHPRQHDAKVARRSQPDKQHRRHPLVVAALPPGSPRGEGVRERDHARRNGRQAGGADASWVFERSP